MVNRIRLLRTYVGLALIAAANAFAIKGFDDPAKARLATDSPGMWGCGSVGRNSDWHDEESGE